MPVLCSEGPGMWDGLSAGEVSTESKLKLCPVCAGLPWGFHAIPSMPCFCGAGDRQPWTGSVGLSIQLGPLGRRERRKGQQGKGDRVYWGWQGISNSGGFKEEVKEGPCGTKKAPFFPFLMNLHKRNVAQY